MARATSDGGAGAMRPGDTARLVALAGGGVAAVDGLLFLLVGAGALFAGPAGAVAGPLLVAAGLALIAGAFLPDPTRTLSLLRRSTPRLYPFGSLALNAALFVLLLIGGAAVFHGLFDVLSGAHNGGQVGTITDQSDLDNLLIGGSVVVWFLTLYAVLGIHRVIQMGRALDGRDGVDVYGRRVEPLPAGAAPGGRPASPPAPEGLLPAVYLVTFVLMVGISAGLQILEVDISPAPALDWLVAQSFMPLLAGPVASGIAMIDRGIRGLEAGYRRVPAEPGPGPAPLPTEAAAEAGG